MNPAFKTTQLLPSLTCIPTARLAETMSCRTTSMQREREGQEMVLLIGKTSDRGCAANQQLSP